MKVLARRCPLCTLAWPEAMFDSFVAPDGKRVFDLFHRECAKTIWPALVSEYPHLRALRDVLFELSKRAEPAAPSKAWDNNIRTPLREGQKPDGVTLDGRTLNTAAGSREDRGSQVWVGKRLSDLVSDVEKRIYPDPSAPPKVRVDNPRCQRRVTCWECDGAGCVGCRARGSRDCGGRGKRQTFGAPNCGWCLLPFETKVAVGVARDD